MATNLRAGVARVTITPPIGIPMIGFAGRGPAAGLHNDLTATALVLEGLSAPLADDPPDDGITRLAIIACDLLFLRTEEVHAVRRAVGRLTDVPPEHVVVTCSHTHYGPLTEPGRDDWAPQVRPYLANLVHLLAGAVALARTDLGPCRLGFGQGEVRIGINRRERTAGGQIILGQNPSGPVDPRMAVLRVDGTDGRPLAAVLNDACHPVSLGSQCTDISADFPGTARRLVEEQTGTTCLFLQGAAGNVNPVLMGWDWTHLARLGLLLGAEAVRVYWSSRPNAEATSGGLGVARSQLDLPPLLPASIAEGRGMVAALEAERDRLQEAGDPGALWWAELRLERTRKGLVALQGGAAVPPVQAELAALRLGHAIGLVTAPGEIFTEIGQSIVSRSPFRHTLYAGYTDGTIGYVPTRVAYAEGSYEVTHACRVAPAAREQIEDEPVRLLRRVHSAT
jgi:neutral ceramidase